MRPPPLGSVFFEISRFRFRRKRNLEISAHRISSGREDGRLETAVSYGFPFLQLGAPLPVFSGSLLKTPLPKKPITNDHEVGIPLYTEPANRPIAAEVILRRLGIPLDTEPPNRPIALWIRNSSGGGPPHTAGTPRGTENRRDCRGFQSTVFAP